MDAPIKLIEPYVDLGNLLLIDRDPLENAISGEDLARITRDSMQHLFNKIWKLPRKVVQEATCAKLPPCEYGLPREKPIPEPKEPTKWEKFAKEKGIMKTKKSKKVWDDTAQEWKPRYGYRKANDDRKDWLIEIPDQKDPYKDYFAEKAEAKREQKSKQELQRLRNIARSAKSSPATAALPSTNGEPKLNGKENRLRRQQFEQKPTELIPPAERSKDQITSQMDTAKRATASMGKFQPKLKGELKPRNTGKKRQFEPNEGKDLVAAEHERQMKILEGLGSKRAKLAENRVNAVNEHLQREDRGTGEARTKEDKRRGGRSKSQLDRQQKFQRFQKQKKGGFKSARSKAGKAAAARGGGKGRK